MAKNKNGWIYLFGAIALIIVFYSLGTFNSTDRNGESSEKEIILDFVGSSQIKTINNPSKVVSIDLVGSSNKISVTKETQINHIEIMGSSNVFNLCKTHSPIIDEMGSSNVFNYLDC